LSIRIKIIKVFPFQSISIFWSDKSSRYFRQCWRIRKIKRIQYKITIDLLKLTFYLIKIQGTELFFRNSQIFRNDLDVCLVRSSITQGYIYKAACCHSLGKIPRDSRVEPAGNGACRSACRRITYWNAISSYEQLVQLLSWQLINSCE